VSSTCRSLRRCAARGPGRADLARGDVAGQQGQAGFGGDGHGTLQAWAADNAILNGRHARFVVVEYPADTQRWRCGMDCNNVPATGQGEQQRLAFSPDEAASVLASAATLSTTCCAPDSSAQ
jgi:hypothetical protein